MAVEFTPWVDGVTQYKAAQMNAPLTEIVDSANVADAALQDNIDGKAAKDHTHVVADITDFPDIANTISSGIVISFEATQKPAAGAKYNFKFDHDVTFSANCSGSQFYNEANPSGTVVVSIKKEGTEFATLSVNSSGTPTWSCSETVVEAGQLITVLFPASQDSTWAGVSMTIKGTRSIS